MKYEMSQRKLFVTVMFTLFVVARLGGVALAIVAADHEYWGVATVSLLLAAMTSFKA